MTIDLKKPWEWQSLNTGKWLKAKREYIGMLTDGKHLVRCPIEGDLSLVQNIRNTPEPEPQENWWELPVERLLFMGGKVTAVRKGGSSVYVDWIQVENGKPNQCVYSPWELATKHITILPPRKSLGWVNVYRDPDGKVWVGDLSDSRKASDELSDDACKVARIACVEIFEGDGL